MKISRFATLLLICLLGGLPVAAFAQPYTISADGSEVIDQRTGLIWRRCSEGLSWNGATCVGVFAEFNLAEGIRHAAAQTSSTGITWRLPNVKELASIVNISRFIPAIDSTAFPVTISGYYLSSTPGYWGVNFGDGSVSVPIGRQFVRLVR